MVKPQFEIGKDRLGRTGVVTSERERRLAVEQGRRPQPWTPAWNWRASASSPLPGQDGNVEYFLWIKRGIGTDLPKIEERDAAVAALTRNESGPSTSSTRRRNPMSRRVLILAHTGREESLKAAWEACAQLHAPASSR